MVRVYMGMLFFCLFCVKLSAQEQPADERWMNFRHLTLKEGLSNNYVLDICQDKEGYIWVATRDGLNRYDGFTFLTFRHDPSDTTSLTGNLITSLEVDSSGDLWAGTTKGLNRFDKMTGAFRRYYFADSSELQSCDSHIRALLAQKPGQLWIETAGGYLINLNTNSGSYERFLHSPPSMTDTYFYHTIFHDTSNNCLWLGGRYMGIYRFDLNSQRFESIAPDPDNPRKKRDNDVADCFVDSYGTFWMSGIDGLYRFDPVSGVFEKILPVSTFSIQQDRRGELWIGTGNGLYLLNPVTGSMRRMQHNDNLPTSIVHNHINIIFPDRSGNIWVGTADGISLFSPATNKFVHIRHIPEDPGTPVSDHITCLVQDRQNRIWVGTAEKGLECFDENFNKLFSYSTQANDPYHLVSDRISTLMVDSHGDIWIGLWAGKGFHIVNPDQGTNRHFRLLPSSMKADWYNDFLEDSNGNYWVGIWGGQGLYLFDKRLGRFKDERFRYLIDGYGKPVKSITHDGKFLWVALESQSYLLALDPATGRFLSYGPDAYNPFGFTKVLSVQRGRGGMVFFKTDKGIWVKNNNPYFSFSKSEKFPRFDDYADEKQIASRILGKEVLSFRIDSARNWWAGTYEGLYKIRGKRIVQQFNVKSGELPSDTVWSLDFHPPDELWIATQRGIARLRTGSNRFMVYNEPLPVYLMSHLVSCLLGDQSGNIWIGTTSGGLNRMNPSTGIIRSWQSNGEDSPEFPGNHITTAFQDSNGEIWIGGMGLNRFDEESESFIQLTTHHGLAGNEVKGILEDDYGFIWISTSTGLSRYDKKNGSFMNFYEQDGLQENEFSGAKLKLNDGRLLFAGKNGISVIDPERIAVDSIPPPVVLTEFRLIDKKMELIPQALQQIDLKYNENYFSFEFAALDFSNPGLNSYRYKLENFDNDWHQIRGRVRMARYTNVNPGNYVFRVKAANMDGVWNEDGIALPVVIAPPFWKTYWFYTLEVLLAISLILLFIQYRTRKIKSQNRFLILEQRLLRSQMNPHFIFNSLSSIQSFIFENNPIQAGSYLSGFAELIRSILYNSREEMITLEKELTTLVNYLELQKLRFTGKFDYEIDVDPRLDLQAASIPPMMAQPFIENAIEHGIKNMVRKGHIYIGFTLLDDSVLLVIEDNGPGLVRSREMKRERSGHRSLATQITRERIDILNRGKRKKAYRMEISEIKDVNSHVKGTRVKIILPLVTT